MPSIWIEFRVASPADNESERTKKEEQIRSLLQAKVNDLQHAIATGSIESLSSAALAPVPISSREKWTIKGEGQADMVEFARTLRDQIAAVLTDQDMRLVTVEII